MKWAASRDDEGEEHEKGCFPSKDLIHCVLSEAHDANHKWLIYALIRRDGDKASVQYREFDEKREGRAALYG
jgi:hypothetical protein